MGGILKAIQCFTRTFGEHNYNIERNVFFFLINNCAINKRMCLAGQLGDTK